jgi:hypothetical protein
MHRLMPPAQAGSKSSNVAIVAITIALILFAGFAANAQTLTNPNPQTTWQPHAAAKSPASTHVKSCAAYGAGFVNVPGTDACVKIGGYVSGEVTSRSGR